MEARTLVGISWGLLIVSLPLFFLSFVDKYNWTIVPALVLMACAGILDIVVHIKNKRDENKNV